MPDRVEKSEAEWREELPDEQYQILRKKGTESAFTGRYWDHKAEGIYRCAACGSPLFSSAEKFDSGTGWPTFYAPIDEEEVEAHADTNLGMHRTEVVCSSCRSHLGHVFDEPPHTKKRYSINSAALQFEPATSDDYPE